MLLRGDWITPTLGGFNWFEKPALLYWLEIVSYSFFGVTEFAARCGLCSVWSWDRRGSLDRRAFRQARRRAVDRSFANWTAMIAASTIGLLAFSHGASFDIVVTFPIAASLAAFWVFDSAGDQNSARRRLLALVLFYFFVGVGLISKGADRFVYSHLRSSHSICAATAKCQTEHSL